MRCLHVRLPDALLGYRVQGDPQADVYPVVESELIDGQGARMLAVVSDIGSDASR